MRERGSGRTEGLCWAALVSGAAVCASALYAMLSNWAVVAAQQVHGGWGTAVLGPR
jgi:hypothetical protein